MNDDKTTDPLKEINPPDGQADKRDAPNFDWSISRETIRRIERIEQQMRGWRLW